MFKIFRTEPEPSQTLRVDLHSHLIPGIDDGVENYAEAIEILTQMHRLGFQKVITTPHIMPEYYPNNPDIIKNGLQKLKQELYQKKLDLEVEAAAEYYLDENLISKIKSQEEIMTFGDSYLLFETAFMNEPANLKEFVFMALSAGYHPVLAHPERYLYLHADFEQVKNLKNRGVLFQVNINSLGGFYSKPVKKFAEKLVKLKMADFLGSDCHNMSHIEYMKQVMNKRVYRKSLQQPLLNNSLIEA